MTGKRNAKKTQAIFWLVWIEITVVLIWGQSLLSADQSSAESDAVKVLLERLLGEGAVAAFVLTYVRKIAHFTEYFILGAEWAAYHRLRPCLWVWGYGLPFAVVDELLQLTAAGRSPGIGDVFLDFTGYVCGWGLITGCLWLARKKKRRK